LARDKGLLLQGKIVEPLLEVAFYQVSLATALSPERWHVSFEFSIAALVGALLAIRPGFQP
jgi:hypothetical protein